MTMTAPLRLCLAGVLAAASLAGPILAVPAGAQLGGIVHDPRNHAQNLLTAARTLEQINNQIVMLQNQATSLLNEARNLTSLPVSTLAELEAQADRTRALLGEAGRIGYDVQAAQDSFARRYRGQGLTGPHSRMVANAQGRWDDSVAAFEQAIKVQAGIVGNLGASRETLAGLVGASQSATGALQAAQAGNQLVALQARQLADLAAVVAAQRRAGPRCWMPPEPAPRKPRDASGSAASAGRAEMRRAAPLAAAAVLAGLFAALGAVAVLRPAASPGQLADADRAPAASGQDTPIRCRAVTGPDPQCEAAWAARRDRFFGSKEKGQ